MAAEPATHGAIAGHLFCSIRQVKDYIAAGVIERGATLDEARAGVLAHLRSRKGGVTDERSRLDAANADLKELELALLRGELLRRADVRETWATQITAAKARLRAIPKRLAVSVPGFSRTMATVALKLIDEVLHELAGDGAPPSKRGARVGKRKGKLAPAGD